MKPLICAVRRTVSCLLLALAPAAVLAQQGMAWRIDTPRGPSYLVGTTHLSLEADYAGGLPATAREALQAVRSVVFEASMLPLDATGRVVPSQWVAELPARYPRVDVADFAAVSDDLAAANRLLLQQLASGQLANPALPAAVVARLGREVDRLIPPSSAADRARAAFLKNGLAATSDAWLLWEIPGAFSAPARGRAAAAGRRIAPGLDSLLMIEGRKAGKRMATLESYPETMAAVSQELNRDGQLESNLLHLIDESLRPDPDQFLFATTHPVYTGDVAAFLAAMEEQGRPSVVYRRVFQTSALVRNRRWVGRVEDWLASDRCPCMFAVGALHLVQEGSLADLLRERGYAISRLVSD